MSEPGSDLRLAFRLAEVADFHARRAGFDGDIEYALVRTLSFERPDDAVFTEQSGSLGDGARRWVLDPIDGRDTVIVLEVRGSPSIAVITRSAQRCRWWAQCGAGAFDVAGHRLRVSHRRDPRTARIARWDSPAGLGAFLSGRVEVLVDTHPKAQRRQALALLVPEAGGRVCPLAGGAVAYINATTLAKAAAMSSMSEPSPNRAA